MTRRLLEKESWYWLSYIGTKEKSLLSFFSYCNCLSSRYIKGTLFLSLFSWFQRKGCTCLPSICTKGRLFWYIFLVPKDSYSWLSSLSTKEILFLALFSWKVRGKLFLVSSLGTKRNLSRLSSLGTKGKFFVSLL